MIRRSLSAISTLSFILFSCQAQSSGYLTEEVSFQSEDDDTIAGMLWLPEGDGPFPAMVLGHGSGRAGYRGGRDAGTYFASRGIAFLSYDKRGVGNSDGTYVQRGNTSPENLNLLAADISNGIKYLRTREDIDPYRIGLWGVSQAGWILPIVADSDHTLQFFILLSGPTVTTGAENVYSDITGDQAGNTSLSQKEISEILKRKGNYGFDPYPYLNRLKMPGLYLLGELDESIPIPETVAVLDRLIEEGKNIHYHVFPGIGHSLTKNGRPIDGLFQKQMDFLKDKAKLTFSHGVEGEYTIS